MEKINCALIGYGYWGHILEKYIKNDSRFELKYIYDLNQNPVLSLDELIECHSLEAVFLCTPADTHYELSKKFLARGVHVFCEKPLAKKAEEVQSLICIAKQKKLCLYVDYIYTVSKSIMHIKNELIHIGEVKFFKGVISQFGIFYPRDTVYEVLGVHLYSILAYLLGSEVKKARILNESVIHREANGNPLDVVLALKFPDHMEALLECSLISDEKRREFKLIGTKGMLSFNMLSDTTFTKTLFKKETCGYSITKVERFSYDEMNNLSLVLDDFFHRIYGGKGGNMNIAENVAFLLSLTDKDDS